MEKKSSEQSGMYVSLFTLSAAVFLFEITLTRLFAIAHFYHFSFMVVSIAMLGLGASGSFLWLYPFMSANNADKRLGALCLGGAVSVLGSYLLFNHLPFDAYRVAIDPMQIAIFLLQITALSLPFFCAGLAVNGMMRVYASENNRVYASNLGGSAAGCLLTPLLLPVLGGVGCVLVCSILAVLAGMIPIIGCVHRRNSFTAKQRAALAMMVAIGVVLMWVCVPESIQRAKGEAGTQVFDLYLSPYKSISYALQYPGAAVAETSWNAFSRVDTVESEGIRSLPGLSYLYPEVVSAEKALFVNGDNLSPVLPLEEAGHYAYLPQALAFQLRPGASVLVLEPRGGMDVQGALAGGAGMVTAVEPNPLLAEAAGNVYKLPHAQLLTESTRTYLQQIGEQYDVIVFSLADGFHPVTSGAYSLGEDFTYTVGAIHSALGRLDEDGLIVISRWLQVPPSEFLRVFITAVEALERDGHDAQLQVAALRGYNLGTLFVSKRPFTQTELEAIRAFAASRAFDLVALPGLQAEESNQFNILPADDYFRTFNAYLHTKDRTAWLRDYPYDVSAPTDDHPFFSHFFKWSQTGQVLAAYGTTWQPFGGAGYLVIVFMLAAEVVLGMVMILVPAVVKRIQMQKKSVGGVDKKGMWIPILYYLLIGLGFMAVEIPMIQQFILLLGQPTYAFSAVLFIILVFSGLGSFLAPKMDNSWIIALGAGVCLSPFWLPPVLRSSVGWTLAGRLAVSALCLTPLGFLMGLPFPKGNQKMQIQNAEHLPLLWAVNGAASVTATVLCAMLVISFGFTALLVGGGLCYLLVYLLLQKM